MKKRLIAVAAILAMLTTGCSETQNTEAETSETTVATTVSTTQTTAITTAKPKKEIAPLKASDGQASFADEDFSVTAEIYDLKSSLYYPDIVTDFGANPDAFVAMVALKVKNISHEKKSFDLSKLSMTSNGSGLFLLDDNLENLSEIDSGKSKTVQVRFLCSLEQISAVIGFEYDGTAFDLNGELLSEEIIDIIDIQSAPDVREYKYRPFVIHQSSEYYKPMMTDTCNYEFTLDSVKGESGNNILVANFSIYNRTDYAQIIDPSGFIFACYDSNDITASYCSVDDELLYEPVKADVKFDGVRGAIYELPEFICMNPEGETSIKLFYDFGTYDVDKLFFMYEDKHENDPCYDRIESVLAFDYFFE